MSRFYASEWRSNISVRTLSGLARCLWLETLCIMHEATPYGYLIVAGNPVSNDDLAALAALPPNQIPSLLDELEKAGVLTRNRKGVIYSQRFLDDEARAINSSIGGKKAQKNKQQQKQQKNRTNRGISDPKQVFEKTKENQGAQSGARSATPTKKDRDRYISPHTLTSFGYAPLVPKIGLTAIPTSPKPSPPTSPQPSAEPVCRTIGSQATQIARSPKAKARQTQISSEKPGASGTIGAQNPERAGETGFAALPISRE